MKELLEIFIKKKYLSLFQKWSNIYSKRWYSTITEIGVCNVTKCTHQFENFSVTIPKISSGTFTP
jgi:hypothetical protein